MINIYYNDNDEKSISKAEKKKALYENKGFTLIKTERISLNKFCLMFKENDIKKSNEKEVITKCN